MAPVNIWTLLANGLSYLYIHVHTQSHLLVNREDVSYEYPIGGLRSNLGGQKDEEKIYSLQVDIIGERAEINQFFASTKASQTPVFLHVLHIRKLHVREPQRL